MTPLLVHVIHQAFFGGIAAAGFGVLFNSPPRMLWLCFGSGALALSVRTLCQDFDLSLPAASFIAALSLAIADRAWQRTQSPQGSVLAAVGCIAMVPGSLAAKAFMGLFTLVRVSPKNDIVPLFSTLQNLIVVTFTLVAIGIGLCIPTLVYQRSRDED